MGIDEQVLRIADGSQHTAEVGRDSLPADSGHDEAYPPGLSKDHNGQGHKDNKGDVIGDEHGAEIAAEDKKSSQGTAGGAAMKHLLKDGSKKAAESEAGHNAHKKEQ